MENIENVEGEYLTIKEFATLVGVSQQAIYKQLSNKLKTYLKVVDGKKYLLKSALNEYAKTKNNKPNEQQLIDMLQSNLMILKEQLIEKDKQIERLQTLLSREQQLKAAENQKFLDAAAAAADNGKSESGLFAMLIGKIRRK